MVIVSLNISLLGFLIFVIPFKNRLYVALGLPLRRKVNKQLTARVKEPLEIPDKLDHTWNIDFVTDILKAKDVLEHLMLLMITTMKYYILK